MKTSIIVSTFAALSIMITLGEAPTLRNSETSNVMAKVDYSILPANILDVNPVIIEAASTKKDVAVKVTTSATDDFDYLKFNATNYLDENEMTSEAKAENSFDYLIFDVNEYSANSERSSNEAELSENEFNYLKFNANNFTETSTTGVYESVELPANDFVKLKFDVNAYTHNSEPESYDSAESVVNEFEHLKFDVNKFNASENASDVLTENPFDEFNYLKFDVNNFAKKIN